MKVNQKLTTRLQGLFFTLFIITVLIPYTFPSYVEFSFSHLDFLPYILSLKVTLLLFIPLGLILIQLILGRIFCSFICPLGNLIRFLSTRLQLFKIKSSSIYIPGIVLLIIIIFKQFTIDLLQFLDPIALTYKFFNMLSTPVMHQTLYNEYSSKLIFDISGYICLGILVLAIFNNRFWCRFFCPLGLLHRINAINPKYTRKVIKCSQCKKCPSECPTQAIDHKYTEKYNPSLCILCFKCIDDCPGKTEFNFK